MNQMFHMLMPRQYIIMVLITNMLMITMWHICRMHTELMLRSSLMLLSSRSWSMVLLVQAILIIMQERTTLIIHIMICREL